MNPNASGDVDPFDWPPNGLLGARTLRRYASWLFPQIRVTWVARELYTYDYLVFDNRGPRRSPELPEYRLPRVRGLYRMRELKHFADFCFEHTGPLTLSIQVIEPDLPLFREEIQGQIKAPKDGERMRWRPRGVLARVSDLRALDAALQMRIKARKQRKWTFMRIYL